MLCNICLIFDSLFLLLYFTTVLHTLSRAAESALADCYQEYGWTWHFAIVFTLFLSASVTFGGIVTHSRVACGRFISVSKVKAVSTFSNVLCAWILCASVAQAIAYKQDTCILAHPEPKQGNFTDIIWQITYMLLWLVWVMSNVGASVLARRYQPFLSELQVLAALAGSRGVINADGMDGVSSNSILGPCPSMPQTVGMPVQAALSSDQFVGPGLAIQASSLSQGTTLQVGSSGVVQGTPVAESSA